jgi:Uri superfamily endonuclease
MKPQAGTYALVLASNVEETLEIGKLGQLQIRPGFYVYVGSAFGPGGVKARITHHQKISSRPRWHIDYLRASLDLKAIWYTFDPSHREHQWVDVLACTKGATTPIFGFCSSDCQCKSHLAFFSFQPSGRSFRQRLHARLANHRKIFIDTQ